MCMSLTHRLQLLLDEERFERVSRSAREQGVSVASVIRRAIDASLAPEDRRRRAAARLVLEAEPMEVPPVDALLDELDEVRGSRR